MIKRQKELLKQAEKIIKDYDTPCSCGSSDCSMKVDQYRLGWAHGVATALEKAR